MLGQPVPTTEDRLSVPDIALSIATLAERARVLPPLPFPLAERVLQIAAEGGLPRAGQRRARPPRAQQDVENFMNVPGLKPDHGNCKLSVGCAQAKLCLSISASAG